MVGMFGEFVGHMNDVPGSGILMDRAVGAVLRKENAPLAENRECRSIHQPSNGSSGFHSAQMGGLTNPRASTCWMSGPNFLWSGPAPCCLMLAKASLNPFCNSVFRAGTLTGGGVGRFAR